MLIKEKVGICKIFRKRRMFRPIINATNLIGGVDYWRIDYENMHPRNA